ncbi:hypothetical protein [Kineobactrum salinum]|uniref:Uncharacterized protein n=1 Tax=Kineobactrum salinum TaxID=2708301 RepID=A0A6C0U6R6_9GAMM|nr:hypothetical protein [Kineobactrum salinum]QIB65144.1 hypothetical protein G3T16_06735 [Kineobactrum salinum]
MTGGETSRQAVDFSAGTLVVQVTANGEPLKARTYVYHADSDEEASRGRVDKEGLVDYDIPPGNTAFWFDQTVSTLPIRLSRGSW